jgi:hypothetical protein
MNIVHVGLIRILISLVGTPNSFRVMIRSLQTFRKHILLLFSGSESKQQETGGLSVPELVGYCLRLQLDYEDGCSWFLRNVGGLVLLYRAWHPRRN